MECANESWAGVYKVSSTKLASKDVQVRKVTFP